MNTFNVAEFRSKFPLLKNKLNDEHLIYFDNAATTQKPQCVIDKHQEYYQKYNANVHRASHQLSATSTSAFEAARQSVKKFINAEHVEEIIWTTGTTESINLLANSLGSLVLEAGDEIILSYSEHHANIVPWQIIAQQKSAVIKVAPLTKAGLIDIPALKSLISSKTKLMSFSHISNVIGKVNPVRDIVTLCKENSIVSIVDGAQAIAHDIIDVQKLGCDFYVFSAHKMYGPTGLGVLYGKREYLNRMPPYQSGGEMIEKVSFSKTTYNSLPFKFEAGTPNIAGVIAFESALDFMLNAGMDNLINYENQLLAYCYKQLQQIEGISFIVEDMPNIPLFSFTIEGHHNHDVASYLDANNIAVRSGHHCAMPLMEYLKTEGCIRVGLTAYNTIEEVDYLINVLSSLTSSSTDTKSISASVRQAHEDKSTSQYFVDKFEKLKGWDSRHREIMLLGKNYTRIEKTLLTDNNLIEGCESKAWLTFSECNGIYSFKADSDAKVIRGLLAIVLAAYSNKTAEQAINFDIEAYFIKLGLKQHLSPSRSNGLMAIVNKIKSIVTERS